MFRKLILLVLAVEVFVYVFINPKKINYQQGKVIGILNKENIDNIKLENYVIGVVAAEMPATFSYEALKAQAVAARTFIYQKIISNNLTYDYLEYDKGQSYITTEEMKNKWKDKFDEYYQIVKSCVYDTEGEIITYNNVPIKSYYFSSSNGFTEDAKMVFEEEPYLISVESKLEINSKEYEKVLVLSKNEFIDKLGLDNNDIIIKNINRSSTNHIINIDINNKIFLGIEVRKKLNLRSTDFDININNDEIKITTRGYGHGVGMSQNGANELAKTGMKYDEIIKYYYKDVSLNKLGV